MKRKPTSLVQKEVEENRVKRKYKTSTGIRSCSGTRDARNNGERNSIHDGVFLNKVSLLQRIVYKEQADGKTSFRFGLKKGK